MQQTKILKIITLVFFVPILASCSGEPSNADIKKSIEDGYGENMNSIFSSKISEMVLSATGVKKVSIENVEKINCIVHGKNSYICEYIVDYFIKSDDGSLAEIFGASGRKRVIARSRFIKTSKSWIIENE